jgi:nucleoside-diphosphate kinase
MERTLVLIKPDAVQRALVGTIINRFERKGLKLIGLKMINLTEDVLQDHYSHIVTKPFYEGLSTFMKSTPVIACCIEGVDCVETVRRISGITNSRKAETGTIRGDFSMSIQTNIVHASDSQESAKTEINRFFLANELFKYNMNNISVIYTSDELGL